MLGKIHYNVGEVVSEPSESGKDVFLIDKIEDYVLPIIEKHLGHMTMDRHRLTIVEQRMNSLEREFKNLRETQEKVIIVEEMDLKTAKQKVLEYTKEHKIFDIEVLHQNIRCDLKLLIEIIDELKKDGMIREES